MTNKENKKQGKPKANKAKKKLFQALKVRVKKKHQKKK